MDSRFLYSILRIYKLVVGESNCIRNVKENSSLRLFYSISMTRLPNTGIWILIWMMVAVILTWLQFPQQVVSGFYKGLREFWINR